MDGSITELGEAMAAVPLDPHYARMVVESRNYDDTIRIQILAAVAAMQDGGIVAIGAADVKKWEKLSKGTGSDILANLDIFVMALQMNAAELESHGVIARKFHKAKNVFYSLCELEDISDIPLEKPNKKDRKLLQHCILTGTDEVFVHVGGGRYRDQRGDKRRVGRESAAGRAKSKLVAGAPFTLSNTSERGAFDRFFVRDATAVSVEQIIESMPERCTFETVQYYLDDQKMPMIKQEVFFDGLPTKSFITTEAPLGPELRDYLIDVISDDSVYDDTLPRITQLRRTIIALKNLQDRAIEPFDADTIINDIKSELKTTAPDSVRNLKDLEKHIDFVSLESYVDKRRIVAIKALSPRSITINDSRVSVTYIDGSAYLTLPATMRTCVPTELPELGERQIYIRFNNREPYRAFLDAQNAALQPARHNRRGKQLAADVPHYQTGRLDSLPVSYAGVMTQPAAFTNRTVQITRGRMRSR